MLDGLSDATIIAIIGFVGGCLLGLAARIGRFCTLGAIEDLLYQNSDIRMRMWGVAIATAGCLVYLLTATGRFDPTQSTYYIATFSPLAHIIGGLLFGYGMSLAGNCGFGALARAGGGDLRAVVIVLVMGISAYMALSGPLAELRFAFINGSAISSQAHSYAELLSGLTGGNVAFAGLLICGSIGLSALWSRAFLTDVHALFWALMVGIAVASGWAGTYWVAQTGFSANSVVSHTFTAPIGETLLFLMTSSAGGLSFAVGSVAGVLTGAFCGSVIQGHFRWEACEDPRELRRQVLGAVFMGLGAALALGCTVGQGISAFSMLTLGAPLTFASIFVGAAIGLRQLITGFAGGA